jgi:hypothetical protein
MNRFDIDSIPEDKLSWIDIVHYILVTPHLLLGAVIILGFVIMVTFGLWVGFHNMQTEQIAYCSDLNQIWNIAGVYCK